MRKLLRYLMLMLAAVVFSLPCLGRAEAASVVLMDLINNTENEQAGQIYFNSALTVLKDEALDYTLEDNDAVQAAIAKNTAEGVLPDAKALAAVCRDAKVDVVIAMQLDTCDDQKRWGNSEEEVLILDLQGRMLAYNNVTGRFVSKRIYNDKRIEEALTGRWDWKNEELGRTIRLEMRRTLKEAAKVK